MTIECKTIFRPYRSKSWILTNAVKSRIQAMHLNHLRGARRDRTRSNRKREELEMKSVIKRVEEDQLKGFGQGKAQEDQTKFGMMNWQQL